jgi:hypothetical protein
MSRAIVISSDPSDERSVAVAVAVVFAILDAPGLVPLADDCIFAIDALRSMMIFLIDGDALVAVVAAGNGGQTQRHEQRKHEPAHGVLLLIAGDQRLRGRPHAPAEG